MNVKQEKNLYNQDLENDINMNQGEFETMSNDSSTVDENKEEDIYELPIYNEEEEEFHDYRNPRKFYLSELNEWEVPYNNNDINNLIDFIEYNQIAIIPKEGVKEFLRFPKTKELLQSEPDVSFFILNEQSNNPLYLATRNLKNIDRYTLYNIITIPNSQIIKLQNQFGNILKTYENIDRLLSNFSWITLNDYKEIMDLYDY